MSDLAHYPVPGFVRRAGKTRHPVGVWLLSLVTCGIYGFVWYYKVNRETKGYDASIKVDPGIAVIAILFGGIIIVPPFVSIYNTGRRIAMTQQAGGLSATCIPIVGLLLAFVASGHQVYYQYQINKVWDRYGNPPEFTPV